MGGQEIDNNGESEFEWVELSNSKTRGDASSDSHSDVSGLLARVVALLLAFAIVVAGTGFLTPAASAQITRSIAAEDVSVDSHNGQLESVTIAPSGTVEYEGLEQQADNVTVTVEASVDGGTWTEIITKEIQASGLNGTVSYDFASQELLGNGNFPSSAFTRPSDGDSAQTDLDVRVTVDVYEVGGGNISARSTTQFAVTVNNTARGAGVGGKVNGNAQGR